MVFPKKELSDNVKIGVSDDTSGLVIDYIIKNEIQKRYRSRTNTFAGSVADLASYGPEGASGREELTREEAGYGAGVQGVGLD